MKKRMICWLMCGAVLAACAGCDNTPDEPTGGETTTVTTVTTTVATTTADSTTTTSTEPTAAPTTTAAPTAEPQIGGLTFTIDGKTFEMGTSPDALLAHLGEPNKSYVTGEPVLGGMMAIYEYDGIRVEAFSPHWYPDTAEPLELSDAPDQVLRAVYFLDDRYSFDGIRVGDTVKKLEQVVSGRVEPNRSYVGAGYNIGGFCYSYMNPGLGGPLQYHGWRFIFQEVEQGEEWDSIEHNNYIVPDDFTIRAIIVNFGYIAEYADLFDA